MPGLFNRTRRGLYFRKYPPTDPRSTPPWNQSPGWSWGERERERLIFKPKTPGPNLNIIIFFTDPGVLTKTEGMPSKRTWGGEPQAVAKTELLGKTLTPKKYPPGDLKPGQTVVLSVTGDR